MKKKRFYNNKKRNTKWTEQEKGRKISFADKYIEAGTGSDKFDKYRPRPKKKRITREGMSHILKNLAVIAACFVIVSIGYTVMDLYIERNAMPIEDNNIDDSASFGDIDLRLKATSVDSLSLDGGVMLDAVIQDVRARGYSSICFDVKRDDGTIGYQSVLATIDAYGAVSSASADLKKSVSMLAQNDILPVARISCYKDNIAPIADLSCAVISGKSVYRDSAGNAYLNPKSDGTYNYIKSIVEEVKGMGVTVFVLDNLTLPEDVEADGQGFEAIRKKLYVDFGDSVKFIEAKHVNLTEINQDELLDYVKENVKPNKDTVYFVSTDDEEGTNSVMAQLSINNYAIIKIEPTVEDNSDEYNYDEDNYDEDNYDEDNYNEDYQE